MLKISLGKSEVAPQKGDKRFTDPAWQQNPLLRATMQSYLTWGTGMERYIDNLGMTGMGVERLRFGAVLLRESMAPTNFLAANPAAVKRFYDTGGASLRGGLANWADDLMHNHRHAVDGRPQAVLHRREPRHLARGGHLPERGLRAEPGHAAGRQCLRRARQSSWCPSLSAGEQVLRRQTAAPGPRQLPLPGTCSSPGSYYVSTGEEHERHDPTGGAGHRRDARHADVQATSS